MNTSGMRTVLNLLGVGWFVAVCIGGGIIFGWLLGGWLNFESPILTLLGLGVGIVLAVLGMVRMLMAVGNLPQSRNGEKTDDV